MSDEVGVFVFFIVIDLILLLRIIKLYVNTEVLNVKLVKNRTMIDDYNSVEQLWEGVTKKGEPVLQWYPISSSKKVELKKEGIYKKIIYDKKMEKFITTPFRRILVDIAFTIFMLLTFLGEVKNEKLVNIVGLSLLLISAFAYGYFRIKPNDDKFTIKKEEKKKVKKLDKLIPWLTILGIFLIIIMVIFIFYETKTYKFTDEEWNYMYEYIDEEFGNGEHFNIISQHTDLITDRKLVQGINGYEEGYHTLGIKASIIGYFDSQDYLYGIVFSKYFKDNKFYEGGKVTFTVVNTNYSKERYLKEVNNSD